MSCDVLISFLLLGAYKTTYLPPGPRVYPGPEAVRKEMDLFKADFNARFKQVAFNSLCCAYYSTFIPCAFATVGNYTKHRLSHTHCHYLEQPTKAANSPQSQMARISVVWDLGTAGGEHFCQGWLFSYWPGTAIFWWCDICLYCYTLACNCNELLMKSSVIFFLPVI